MRLDPTIGSEIAKTRPCLVVTNDFVNVRRRTVVIVPVSSGPRPEWPLSIALESSDSVIGVGVIDQVRAAAKERFSSRIGIVSAEEMAAVAEALRRTLGLD